MGHRTSEHLSSPLIRSSLQLQSCNTSVLLATIDNGMSILNVSAFLQMVVKGFVLLSALSVDSYMMKRRTS
jgi:predicted ABC-type sugar transport system permease subunit